LSGQYPAPHKAKLIAIILRKLKLNDLEEEFLAAFHDKFFDGNGRTYQDIGARLLQLRAKKIPRS
jgi:hypothetical protein